MKAAGPRPRSAARRSARSPARSAPRCPCGSRAGARARSPPPSAASAPSRSAVSRATASTSILHDLVDIPASRAASASNVSPSTSSAKARWSPMMRGPIRLEPASGVRPRSMKGRAEDRTRRGKGHVAMHQQRRADADRQAVDAAIIGFGAVATASGIRGSRRAARRLGDRQEILDVVAGGKGAGHAADQDRRTASSPAAPWSAAVIVRYMSSVMAFFLSGRSAGWSGRRFRSSSGSGRSWSSAQQQDRMGSREAGGAADDLPLQGAGLRQEVLGHEAGEMRPLGAGRVGERRLGEIDAPEVRPNRRR